MTIYLGRGTLETGLTNSLRLKYNAEKLSLSRFVLLPVYLLLLSFYVRVCLCVYASLVCCVCVVFCLLPAVFAVLLCLLLYVFVFVFLNNLLMLWLPFIVCVCVCVQVLFYFFHSLQQSCVCVQGHQLQHTRSSAIKMRPRLLIG